MKTMAAGLDIGSTTIKLAVVEDGQLMKTVVRGVTGQPMNIAMDLIRDLPSCPLMATGYGRERFSRETGNPAITEIRAHALGASFLVPGCTGVIDVGGQDLKVIALDSTGRVSRFEMNDRCAAGTGRFLEVMASRLGFSLPEFGKAALTGKPGLALNAQCTVFAESEAVGLLHDGVALPDIALALHHAVAIRIAGLFKRVAPEMGVMVLSGGGALNPALKIELEKILQIVLRVPPQAQVAGAVGCALEALKTGT